MTNMKQYVFRPYKVIKVKCTGSEKPRPRSGHRICTDDVNIYCFGGYNPALPVDDSDQIEDPTWTPERPLFKELWSFNISSRRWKQHKVVENMPDELASNAMCANGRYLMIFGGTGSPFGDRCSNDVIAWRSCPGDAKFEILNVHGVKPPGQYGQAILCHDNYFYTVGGTNGFAYNCDIYRLDLRTLGWEPIHIGSGADGDPLGRYRHEIARVGEKLYIIGGGTGEWSFELMELPMFDIKKSKWTLLVPKPDNSLRKPLAPLPRKCHSAVQVNTDSGPQVFVAGGSDGNSVFEDIWRLDLNSLQWTLMRKTVLPFPLYFHSAAVTSSGCMYIFGGIEPREEAACRNNYLFKCWLCIPKLSEMCWEALSHYCPDLHTRDKNSLHNSGIPLHFLERLMP